MNNDLIIRECKIRVSDQVILDGDLYLPCINQKLPNIIMRTPYGKHNINAVFDPLVLARKGFAVLVQNVRGRYESSGIFTPFENELEDGNKTIEWILSQEWSNGNIYALGVSYEGFTSILLGSHRNTKAIAPIMSSSDIRRDWFYENNCIKQGFVQSWSHSFAFTDNGELLDSDTIDHVQFLANDIKKLYYAHLSDFPVSKLLPYYNSWINMNDEAYWTKIKNRTDVDNNSATYYVSGWYDIFCEGSIQQFNERLERSTSPSRLVVGPWSHAELFGSVVGDKDFGVYSFEKYSSMDIIDWFSMIENGQSPESKISLYIMGINKWYHTNMFPDVQYKSYYLSNKDNARMLSEVFEGDHSTDCFIFDSTNPVPTCGGRCIDAIPEALGGPKLQTLIEQRNDVLSYTSEEMDSNLTILGKVFISLSCSSESDSMDYTIKLCDVDEKDNSINLLDSCIRITQGASTKGTHKLCLGTVGHSFIKGHKIRIEIASSNFPRLNIQDIILNTLATNTIYIDGISAIDLPVVDIEL